LHGVEVLHHFSTGHFALGFLSAGPTALATDRWFWSLTAVLLSLDVADWTTKNRHHLYGNVRKRIEGRTARPGVRD
jgi:hypothetical protein